MSYLVLARKYRPQSFEEVVGQNPVSQTLLNALESGRVAHAYIFSGPRGVGKTTTARILAKCLNCEKGPTKTPCNECDACRSISQSNSTDDVLEIDGASNRGIEQIRELRESAKYAPARSRYRIFIIDEAHQITKDAFGALLKTLEEPPAHVVFMMATTEVQKIPAPILSRCQRFSLRPISPELVLKHLKEICQREKVKVDDEALADIVRFVEGSLRDALSLLDQALVFAPNGITSHTVRDLLGLLPMETIQSFAAVIQAGEPGAILRNVSESLENGVDLTQLGKDLQNYYHSLLLAKAGVEDAFKLAATDMKKAAAETDYLTLERNIRLLSRALDEMRRSDTPRAIFEVYALRLAQKTLDGRALVERLEKLAQEAPAGAPPRSAPAAPAPARPAPTPTPSFREPKAAAPPAVPSPRSAPLVKADAPPAASKPESAAPGGGAAYESRWGEFVTEVGAKKGPVAAALEQAAVKFTGTSVVLTFNRSFHQDIVTRSLDLLTSTFAKKFGAPLTFDIRLDRDSAPQPPAAGTGPAAGAPAPRPAESRAINAEDAETFEEVPPSELTPEAQAALKHFPGPVKRERKG